MGCKNRTMHSFLSVVSLTYDSLTLYGTQYANNIENSIINSLQKCMQIENYIFQKFCPPDLFFQQIQCSTVATTVELSIVLVSVVDDPRPRNKKTEITENCFQVNIIFGTLQLYKMLLEKVFLSRKQHVGAALETKC